MAACIVVTLPLELVLGARVWRRPRRVLTAIALPVVVFMMWDAVAIGQGQWWFNPRFVTGVRLPFDVPIEELVFFVVVPICALLTYEAVTRILRRRA
jgi:lycopene beta-cyclase